MRAAGPHASVIRVSEITCPLGWSTQRAGRPSGGFVGMNEKPRYDTPTNAPNASCAYNSCGVSVSAPFDAMVYAMKSPGSTESSHVVAPLTKPVKVVEQAFAGSGPPPSGSTPSCVPIACPTQPISVVASL